MELPADLFEDVTGSTGAPQPAAPVDARQGGDAAAVESDRVFLSRRALVAPISGTTVDTSRMAMVRDISRASVCILHDRKLRAGEEFVLYLPRRQEDARAKPIPVRCKTTRCDKSSQKDGPFLIAANFTAVLDPAYAAGVLPAEPSQSELDEARRIQQAMFT